jgi:hypothetical protein
MLFTALKPMIQLIQSEDIPTANRVRMEHFNGIIRLHFAEIITAILTGEDVKEENKQAIAARFLKLAEMCVDQCSFSLRDEFKKIRAACESVLKP